MKSRSVLFLIIIFFFSFLNHAHAFLEDLPPEIIWRIINHIPPKHIPYQYKVAQGYISFYRPQDAQKCVSLFQLQATQKYIPLNQRQVPQKYISLHGQKSVKKYVLLAPRSSPIQEALRNILLIRHGMILSLRLVNKHFAGLMSGEDSPLEIELSEDVSRWRSDNIFTRQKGTRVIENPSPYLPAHVRIRHPSNDDLQKLGRSQAKLKSLRFSCSYLSRYEKADYENLPAFTSLTKLYIESVDGFLINEGQFLAPLTNLQNLTMSGCHGLENLKSMTQLTNLHTLSLYGYDFIKDLSHISQLTKLKMFYLTGTSLKTFPSFSALTNLKTLGIHDYELTTTAPFMNIPHLTSLYLYGCRKLREIDQLSTLTTLQDLNLGSTGITTLQPLTTLQKLKDLDLSRVTKVITFNPLSHLVNLESLNIDLAGVDSYEFLKSLTCLKKLRIEEEHDDKGGEFYEVREALPNLKVSISKHDYEEGY